MLIHKVIIKRKEIIKVASFKKCEILHTPSMDILYDFKICKFFIFTYILNDLY